MSFALSHQFISRISKDCTASSLKTICPLKSTAITVVKTSGRTKNSKSVCSDFNVKRRPVGVVNTPSAFRTQPGPSNSAVSLKKLSGFAFGTAAALIKWDEDVTGLLANKWTGYCSLCNVSVQ